MRKTTKTIVRMAAVFAAGVCLLGGCGKDTKPTSYDYPDLGIRLDLKGKWLKEKQNIYVSPVYGQSYSPISGLIINYQDKDYPDVIRSLVTVAYADMEAVTLDHLEEMIGGPDRIADVQEIGKAGENTYYFCSFPEDSEGLSENQKKSYLNLFDNMETAKENITISEATYSSELPNLEGTVSIPENTVDLDGNPVSGDIFADNTLTMINIWGSFCNPCIEEMPMLEQMNGDLKEKNVAIIGVLGDAAGSDGGRVPGRGGNGTEKSDEYLP